jgi:DNA-binding transcriptional MerR regulator
MDLNAFEFVRGREKTRLGFNALFPWEFFFGFFALVPDTGNEVGLPSSKHFFPKEWNQRRWTMEKPRTGKWVLSTQMMAMTGALFLVGGLTAQGGAEKDRDTLRAFEQEQAQIQNHIEKRMKDLELKIQSLKKRLEKERFRVTKALGKNAKVIERKSESEIQMRMGKDGVRIEIKEKGPDGKVRKKVYEDKDLKSLLRAHPELKKKISLGGGFGWPLEPKLGFDFGVHLGPKGKGFQFPSGLPLGKGQIREFMEEMRRMVEKDFVQPRSWVPGLNNLEAKKRLEELKRIRGFKVAPLPGMHGKSGPIRVYKNKGQIRVEIRTPNGTRAFEGKDLDTILRKHPELKGTLKTFKDYSKKHKSKGLRPEFGNRSRGGGNLRPNPSNDGPKLGIYLNEEALSSAMREYLDIPEGAGLWVQDVVKGSLAEKMGMRKKDILLRLNGRLIKGPRDVAEVLGRLEDDAPVKAEVLRRGREVVLKTRR